MYSIRLSVAAISIGGRRQTDALDKMYSYSIICLSVVFHQHRWKRDRRGSTTDRRIEYNVLNSSVCRLPSASVEGRQTRFNDRQTNCIKCTQFVCLSAFIEHGERSRKYLLMCPTMLMYLSRFHSTTDSVPSCSLFLAKLNEMSWCLSSCYIILSVLPDF
jgi:hypothetical protein